MVEYPRIATYDDRVTILNEDFLNDGSARIRIRASSPSSDQGHNLLGAREPPVRTGGLDREELSPSRI